MSCDQRYTIKDVTPPTIHTRLDTIKIACDQDSLIEIALKMEDVVIDATDNCSTKDEIEIVKNIQKNQSEDTHDCAYNNYTIWRTWIAKDKCGNESTPLIQVVLVVDSIAPKFVLPENFRDTVLASNIKKCTMTVPPLYTKFKSYVLHANIGFDIGKYIIKDYNDSWRKAEKGWEISVGFGHHF